MRVETVATTEGPVLTAEGPATRRRPRGSFGGTRLVSIVAVVLLFLFIFGPLLWLLVWAFVGVWHYPALLPQKWSLSWWRQVFNYPSLARSVELSFLFAPTVTALSAVICLPAAYAFARFRIPGRRALMIILFSVNAFPKIGLYITIATLFYALNLMGTFLGVVLIQLLGTIVFMTWIPTAAFAAVPRSLEEAARDVGASRLRTFFTVTLPLAAPGIFVAMVLAFLASLDEAQGTFLVGIPNYVTMPVQMYSLVSDYPPEAAAVFAVLLSVPSVVLMLLVRKHVMGGSLARGFQV
ncbi:MAG: ABC transporter permease [Acidimicrobiales bacterium]|jgi:putative spermidine/putrescine transport system permease protein